MNGGAGLPSPPPSPAALWSTGAHGTNRRRRSGGTRTRITAAKATAPAGNYGEGQDRQHTERAGQNRSGNAGNGSPQTVSVFLLLWGGVQQPGAAGPAGAAACSCVLANLEWTARANRAKPRGTGPGAASATLNGKTRTAQNDLRSARRKPVHRPDNQLSCDSTGLRIKRRTRKQSLFSRQVSQRGPFFSR